MAITYRARNLYDIAEAFEANAIRRKEWLDGYGDKLLVRDRAAANAEILTWNAAAEMLRHTELVPAENTNERKGTK